MTVKKKNVKKPIRRSKGNWGTIKKCQWSSKRCSHCGFYDNCAVRHNLKKKPIIRL